MEALLSIIMAIIGDFGSHAVIIVVLATTEHVATRHGTKIVTKIQVFLKRML